MTDEDLVFLRCSWRGTRGGRSFRCSASGARYAAPNYQERAFMSLTLRASASSTSGGSRCEASSPTRRRATAASRRCRYSRALARARSAKGSQEAEAPQGMTESVEEADALKSLGVTFASSLLPVECEPLIDGIVPFLEFCLRQVLAILHGHEPPGLLVGVDHGGADSGFV